MADQKDTTKAKVTDLLLYITWFNSIFGFFLRPARPFVVSKSFQQPNQKMPILLYEYRENLMFYKEPYEIKRPKGFRVLGTKKIEALRAEEIVKN